MVATLWFNKIFAAFLVIKNKGGYDAKSSVDTVKQVCMKIDDLYKLETIKFMHHFLHHLKNILLAQL